MFTIKVYGNCRQRIYAADSFTILRDDYSGAEITLHRKSGDDIRVDIGDDAQPWEIGKPEIYSRAIIENAAGKTTEIISYMPQPVKGCARPAGRPEDQLKVA